MESSPESNGSKRDQTTGRFLNGNPGKPKGAVTKISGKVRESLVKFMEDNIDAVQESFDQLTAKEKLGFISEILSYAVPKLSATQTENDVSGTITIRFEKPESYVYPSGNEGDNGEPEGI
jgi:hypothetical protein